jgi:hypothetical protein
MTQITAKLSKSNSQSDTNISGEPCSPGAGYHDTELSAESVCHGTIMTTKNHAVVWIDHREARIFHFDRETMDTLVIHPANPTKHLHHKAHEIGSGNAAEDQNYYHSVAEALGDAEAILITGPADAKTELVKHIQAHDPKLADKIKGVETVDHPTDNQIVAYARKTFKDDHQVLPRS